MSDRISGKLCSAVHDTHGHYADCRYSEFRHAECRGAKASSGKKECLVKTEQKSRDRERGMVYKVETDRRKRGR